MNRATRLIVTLSAIAFLSAPCLAQEEGAFLDGRWGGAIDLGAEGPEVLVLRLFPADPETGAAAGGLVDMPSRGIFGFPLGFMERNSEGIFFSLVGASTGGAARSGAFFDSLFELKVGSPLAAVPGDNYALSGTVRVLSAEGEGARKTTGEGTFKLVFTEFSSRGLELGVDCSIDTGRGLLSGSFLMPERGSSEAVPVVLLLSGADADRDGNNYSVPGRSDSLALLAMALRSRGIASLRFDKRGTGESYRLVGKEEDLVFDDHVEDARAALRLLATDPRFSSVTIAGMGQGVLVGVCALSDALAEADAPISRTAARVRGIVALCASGRSEKETVEAALSSAPGERKDEAAAIMSALESGEAYPNPSPYFADYFRPSIQPYLISLFKRDIRAALADVRLGSPAPCPVLVLAGGSDLQVAVADAELLASAGNDAAFRVVPGMSHTLKEVGADEESNYASFTDPKLPLADGLVDLVEAFVKGEPLAPLDGAQGGQDSAE
jgi:hypothetical protein